MLLNSKVFIESTYTIHFTHRVFYFKNLSSRLDLWKITWGLLYFFTLSCASKTMPTDMTLDQAIRLTQAWGEYVHEPFEQATISPNGDFRGLFAGAEIAYNAKEKILVIEGLVIHDASILVKAKEFFDEIKRAGDREPSTRGEGYFYIETTLWNILTRN